MTTSAKMATHCQRKRTNICQVGFSANTRTDPFFVVAENSVTERLFWGASSSFVDGKKRNRDNRNLDFSELSDVGIPKMEG